MNDWGFNSARVFSEAPRFLNPDQNTQYFFQPIALDEARKTE